MTAEIEAQLNTLRESWLEQMTTPLDHSAVRNVYRRIAMRYKCTSPTIQFVPSPRACNEAWALNPVAAPARFRICIMKLSSTLFDLEKRLWTPHKALVDRLVEKPLRRSLNNLDDLIYYEFHPTIWDSDFNFDSTEQLNSSTAALEANASFRRGIPSQALRLVRDFVWHCGDSTEGKGHVILNERPVVWRRDEAGLTHADGEPAVLYSDGWGVWAWHGVLLRNPRYHVPSREWQEDWLLDEPDERVRQALLERRALHAN